MLRKLPLNSNDCLRVGLVAGLGMTLWACSPEPDRLAGGSVAEEERAVERVAAPESTPADRDRSVVAATGDASAAARHALIDAASADLVPTEGHTASGKVTFSPEDGGEEMQVSVRLSGVETGLHGFHIHAVGSCAADDASSAGGHFNPYDSEHGGPSASRRHLGDLGNIIADADGEVETSFRVSGLAFSGPASILQKAVIVHAGEDDLKTDPAGDAGERIACGLIRQERDVLANSPG